MQTAFDNGFLNADQFQFTDEIDNDANPFARYHGQAQNQVLKFVDWDNDGLDDIPADIHFSAGMECMDCHTSAEMHNELKYVKVAQVTDWQDPSQVVDMSGAIWSHMDQSTEVECVHCHGNLEYRALPYEADNRNPVKNMIACAELGETIENYEAPAECSQLGRGRWMQSKLVQALVGKITDRKVVTFGFNAQADVRAVNLTYKAGVAHFDIALQAEDMVIEDCSLPMPGDHNVSNALAAVAVARHLGMKRDEIRDALAAFGGVNRRFTKVGEVNGITVIDDYGHHPVEIAAVLKAARQATEGRVIAVHQPHRYSRLHSLFEDFCSCFNDADVVGIAEVYAAGEDPIKGAGRDDLVAGLIRHGHRHARAIMSEDDLERMVREQARPGDMVVCLGAGTISAWANGLPARLTE